MSSHYVLIFVQKNDTWVPGCTRNPETYILKDQVLILFVSLTFVFLEEHLFRFIFLFLLGGKVASSLIIILILVNMFMYTHTHI